MLPRPLLLTGCFLLAAFAGKAAREARVRPDAMAHAAIPPEAAAPSAPPMPQGMDDLTARTWLAENLPDAGKARLGEIAARLAAGDPQPSHAIWKSLFSCWMEKDPSAAWAFAAENPDLRAIALKEWAACDPAAARKVLESADDYAALVRGAMQKDVVAAFRLLDEALAAEAPVIGDTMHFFGVTEEHFADFASKDPDAAMAWAERLDKVDDLDGALLWGRWEHNPAAAKAWLAGQEKVDILFNHLAYFADAEHYRPALMDFIAENCPAGNLRNEAIQNLLEGVAYQDPDFAAKEAARVIPDQTLRAETIGQIASMVARTDFAKAWSLLETLDPAITGIRRVDLPEVEIHAGEEFQGVTRAYYYGSDLTGMRGLESPAAVRSGLLENLIETDKRAAIGYLDRLSVKDFGDVGYEAFQYWAIREPEDAIPWLARKFTAHGDVDDVVDLIPSEWTNIQTAPGVIAELPQGTVRDALVALTSDELANEDPLAALDFARQWSTAGEPVMRVYETWADTDPEAALQHLAEDEAASPEAWAEVCGETILDHPNAVADAIGGLPEGPAREAAIVSVVKAAKDTGPLAAMSWAIELHEPDQRQKAIGSVIDRISLDLQLARYPGTVEMLQELMSDLPPAEQAHWAERINREFTAP